MREETFFVILAVTFLGASVKLRTATVGFVISVRPFVYTLATIRLPLEKIFMKFDIGVFCENLSGELKFH